MRIIGIVLGVLVAIVVAALIIIPIFVSTEDILSTTSKSVKESTGRILNVKGEHNLKVFPSLVIELSDVEFSNFEQSDQAQMATMQTLKLHIPWISVFEGTFRVEQFVVEEMHLLLETTTDGNANWQFNPTQSEQAADQSKREAGKLPENFDISLGQVQINGGSVTFKDHQAQTTEKIENLALDVLLPSLRQPMQVNGGIRFKEQDLTVSMVVDTPRKAMEGEQFDTSIALTSTLMNLNYSGSVLADPLMVSGALSVAGNSVKDIAAWLNQPLVAKDNAFNQFSLSAQMQFNGKEFQLQKLQAGLDELNIQGQATMQLADVPSLTATIDLGDLNFNPYIPEATTEEPVQKTSEKTPIVWDESDIDLSALSSINLDVSIASNSLQARDLKLGKNRFKLKLSNGVMALNMDEFNAYQGTGIGSVNLDASSSPYTISTEFSLTGIDFQPLLTDAIGFERVMGAGQFQWQMNTSGSSQKEFISALSGSLGFEIKDGAIRGANIPAIVESASNALKGNLAAINLDTNFNQAEKTDFASFTGSMQFDNGVGSTNDIVLLNPLVRLNAEGKVDLPGTNMDMRSTARLVKSLQGQGAQTQEKGIVIPIKIEGPLHDVAIKPDLAAGLKENLNDKVKDKIKDKLRNLFGG